MHDQINHLGAELAHVYNLVLNTQGLFEHSFDLQYPERQGDIFVEKLLSLSQHQSRLFAFVVIACFVSDYMCPTGFGFVTQTKASCYLMDMILLPLLPPIHPNL